MSSIDRWRYPWIVLTAGTISLAVFGYYLAGISLVSIYPALVSVGVVVILARPTAFGVVLFGLGAISIAVAGVFEGQSTVVRGAVGVVGVGALISGLQTRRNRNADQ